MSLVPRIAIPVPTSIDQEYNRQSFGAYLQAITRAGGEAVPVPLDQVAAEIAASCDGVLLPGSLADVRPTRYGQQADPDCGAPDALREAADIALLDHAERFSKPVMGICYGLQSINVWRGGTLLQNLGVRPVNHAAGRAVAIAHTALVSLESRLGSLLDDEEAPCEPLPDTSSEHSCRRLPVNSSHHQAVAALGDGLVTTARCPQDGVIEAIEFVTPTARGQFLVAVQWHPERSFDGSAASRSLFKSLIEAAQG